MTVPATTLESFSRLHEDVRHGDFLDCFSVRLRNPAPLTETTQRIFIDLPVWIRGLLLVRDVAITPLGLKTTAGLPSNTTFRDELLVGDAVGFLCVRELSDDEIILGEEDAHLDFKISVHRTPSDPQMIGLATWVRCKNRFGRVYLKTITPFHKRIVKSRLSAVAGSRRSHREIR